MGYINILSRMHAQMLNSRCSKKGQHGPTATASELSPKPRPPPAVAMTRCVAPFVPIPFSRSETLVTLTFTTALRPHSPHVNTILNILNHSLFALSFLGHHLIVLVSRCFKHKHKTKLHATPCPQFSLSAPRHYQPHCLCKAIVSTATPHKV